MKPSAESWSTLTNRLDAEQKNKSKNLFWRFGIAASIVGIAFVSTIYFNNNSIENNTTTIVNANDNLIQQKDSQKIEVPIKNEKVAVEEVHPLENVSNKRRPKSTIKSIVSKNNSIATNLTQAEVVAKIENNSYQESIKNVAEIKKSTFTLEEQKIQEVVAEINALKPNGDNLTDTEIESLLKKAQKEILSNKIYNEKTGMVDANALRGECDEELKRSVRSKGVEALRFGE